MTLGFRGVLAAGVAACATCVSPATAFGSSVVVANHQLVYTATGRAANDVRLARHSGLFVVRDLTAPLAAGAGCASVGAHKATCAAAGIRSFTAGLGPGNDRAVVANLLRLPSIVVRGGTGADSLESVVAHVDLRGGPGSDRLHGGLRQDVLRGKRGADVIRGGDGADLMYGGRADDLLLGGRGADREYGGAGDDRVYGSRGPDRLNGGADDDILADFFGLDRLIGGTGEDYLNTYELDNPNGEPGDFLNAGAGPDYGCRASPGDILVGCDENAK